MTRGTILTRTARKANLGWGSLPLGADHVRIRANSSEPVVLSLLLGLLMRIARDCDFRGGCGHYEV